MTTASVLPISLVETVLEITFHIPESLMEEWMDKLDRSGWCSLPGQRFSFESPGPKMPGLQTFWVKINREDEVGFLNFLDIFAKTYGTHIERMGTSKT